MVFVQQLLTLRDVSECLFRSGGYEVWILMCFLFVFGVFVSFAVLLEQHKAQNLH